MTFHLEEFLRNASAVIYALLALIAVRVWRRERTPHAAWLTAAFCSIAGAILLGRVLRDLDDTMLIQGLRVVLVMALVAFPYLIFRFASTFRGKRRRWETVLHVVSWAVIAGSLAAPWFPESGEPRPAWFWAYLLVLLSWWFMLSMIVAVWLFRAGRGQPRVARRRMRLMGVASIILSVALITQAGGPSDTRTVAANLLAALAAGLFVLGFAPPRFLREAWRGDAFEQLREAESRLMAATSRTDVATSLLPPAAEILGGGAAALFGRDGDPILNHGFDDSSLTGIRATLGPSQMGKTATALSAPALEHNRLVVPLRSGWLVIHASPYAPFFGSDEIALISRLGLLVDLAWGRIELFEAERRLREDLQQTNQELEGIVYGLSHDLRNPLVTILGYLDVLESDYAATIDDQGRHFLRRMRLSASYMDALIRDLLELSRVGRSEEEPAGVDLNELLEEIRETLARAHPEARFTIERLPAVRIGPTRARQLFTNLLENAVRHAGRNDVHVQVTTDALPDGTVQIGVSDNGKGIPPDYRETIFGIFEQLNPASERTGTGIGLAICRKIVEQFAGQIEVVDPLTTTGAQFRVTFPSGMARPLSRLETTS